jgi:hypothetical protein
VPQIKTLKNKELEFRIDGFVVNLAEFSEFHHPWFRQGW